MKIVTPKVECWKETEADDKYHHFAKCAAVCYATTKVKDYKRFADNRWKEGHCSMFRHISRYYIIPLHEIYDGLLDRWSGSPYIDYVKGVKNCYIATNEQYVREHGEFVYFEKYEIDTLTAFNNSIFYQCKLLRYTFVIDTGIDITRELNRTSPNAIAEQSTRYVDFIKKIGIKFKKCHWMNGLNLYRSLLVKFMTKVDECFYKISRSKYGLNLKPQDARWCLFLDTMSKVVYTYSVKEWEHILELRYAGITGMPHPDAMSVAKDIYMYLTEEEGYKLSF